MIMFHFVILLLAHESLLSWPGIAVEDGVASLAYDPAIHLPFAVIPDKKMDPRVKPEGDGPSKRPR